MQASSLHIARVSRKRACHDELIQHNYYSIHGVPVPQLVTTHVYKRICIQSR